MRYQVNPDHRQHRDFAPRSSSDIAAEYMDAAAKVGFAMRRAAINLDEFAHAVRKLQRATKPRQP